jgi:hypothetical protein
LECDQEACKGYLMTSPRFDWGLWIPIFLLIPCIVGAVYTFGEMRHEFLTAPCSHFANTPLNHIPGRCLKELSQ